MESKRLKCQTIRRKAGQMPPSNNTITSSCLPYLRRAFLCLNFCLTCAERFCVFFLPKSMFLSHRWGR